MSIWDNIAGSFRFPKEVYGLECFFSADRTDVWVCHISRTKEDLHLLEQKHYPSLEAFAEEAQKNIPILLMASGQKVMQKTVSPIEEESSQSELIARAFPNIDRKSLLFQFHLSENKAVVSATRLEVWEQLTETLNQKGLCVLDFIIGPAALLGLLQKTTEDKVQLGSYVFDLRQNAIALNPLEEEEEIKLFDQKVKNSNALAYLTGLRFMASRQYVSEQESVEANRKDYLYKNLYTKGMMIAGSFILVLLLISFMVYNNYFEKNQALSQQTASYEQQIQKVNELKANYDNKVQFLAVNGANKLEFARMGDQLASTIPAGISLSNMDFFPMEKKLKKENLVRFYQNRLVVSGETNNHSFFESWLQEVNQLSWVKEIQIIGYHEMNVSHRADFTLNITLEL